MDVLRVPQIGLVLLGLFTFQWCGSFSDSTLADHLSVLHRSHMFPSLMISLCAFVAMLASPFWGLLVDRVPSLSETVMVIGSLLEVAFALIFGPSPLVPFMHLTVSWTMVAFALQGMAFPAISTPSLKYCIRAAKESGGFSETAVGTSGSITGLMQASVSTGAFIGDTVGGFAVQKIGFEWTATLTAVAQLPFILGLIAFRLGKYVQKRCAGEEEQGEGDGDGRK